MYMRTDVDQCALRVERPPSGYQQLQVKIACAELYLSTLRVFGNVDGAYS